MRSLAALAPVVLLLAPAKGDDPPKKAPTAAGDLQRLQGTWQVEAWEEAGKALAPADLKKRGVFFGANLFVFRRDDKVYQAGAVQLDPGKSPCTVNLSVKEGEGKDGVLLGIYSLEGGTLRLCYDPQGQNRPADFKPEAKAGFTLVTLRKPKPPADESAEIVGKYRSEMVDQAGKTVVTEALIEKRGDAYLLTYRLGDRVLFAGAAMRKGDQLSMAWISSGQVGVSVYKIETGPKLVGEYTVLGGIGVIGKEVLTPWRQID